MDRFQGLLGVVAIIGFVIVTSRHRKAIRWRILAAGLALQVLFALFVLKVPVGVSALKFTADVVSLMITFTDQGTKFLFGPLFDQESVGFVFAFNVLPVIIFLGAVIGALYYLRVIQFMVDIIGAVLKKILGTSKIESVWSSTVIFLGQSEAPLMIAPYLPRLTRSELFVCMSGGFASVAGSTLVGYSLLGAPLPYLLAASIMNAPGFLLLANAFYPETEKSDLDASIRDIRDEKSANIIDALGHGAMSGGKIAVTIGCLLIAFIGVIAMMSGILSGVGGLFGYPELTLDKVFGWIFAPVAWLIGTPWSEAAQVGSFIGQKTVLNEFIAYGAFGPEIPNMSPKAVMITTFALAGFSNFASIAIQIGTFGSLVPERRGEVAKLGLLALLMGFLTNMLNAAIVGVIA